MQGMMSQSALMRTGIYTGVNVAVEFGKGMSPDMQTFMDSVIYWLGGWVSKYLLGMWGMSACDNGGSCKACLTRNAMIVIMELLYDAFMYGGMPGITDILQQITAVFSVDIIQAGIFKGSNIQQ